MLLVHSLYSYIIYVWESVRERNLHSSHWFYPLTREIVMNVCEREIEREEPSQFTLPTDQRNQFHTFDKVMNFFILSYIVILLFLCPPWYWYGTQRKLHLNPFWCFIMLHLIFKIGFKLIWFNVNQILSVKWMQEKVNFCKKNEIRVFGCAMKNSPKNDF